MPSTAVQLGRGSVGLELLLRANLIHEHLHGHLDGGALIEHSHDHVAGDDHHHSSGVDAHDHEVTLPA